MIRRLRTTPCALLAVAMLVALTIPCVADSGPHTAIRIDSSFTQAPLGLFLSHAEDPSSRMTMQQIAGAEADALFHPVHSERPTFGYSKSTRWFRFSVRNDTGKPAVLYLNCDYPIIDLVKLHYPAEHGFRVYQAGDRIPFMARPFLYHTIVFPIELNPGVSTYYLSVQSSGAFVLPLTLHTEESLNSRIRQEQRVLWLFYGFMIAFIIYNLFIFFSFRNFSYLYLVLFTLSISLFSMAHNGLAFQHLWPNFTAWQNISHPLFIFLSISFFILFTRSFLNTGAEHRDIDRILKIFLVINLCLSLTPFFINYYIVTQASGITTIINSIVCVTLSFIIVMRGSKPARLYLTTWIVFLSGVSSTSLLAFGILPATFFTMYGYQIGTSFMVIMLSIGVTEKINTIRKEHERALAALRESEEKYRILVENAREGILVLQDRRILYCNRALLAMTGYAENEFYSLDFFASLLPDTPKGRGLVSRQYEDRIAGIQGSSQYEAQVLSKTGEIIDVMISAAPVIINSTIASLSIISDITRMKKAEATIIDQYNEIQTQYEELEALNEELVATQDELVESGKIVSREKEQLLATLRSISDAVITTDSEGKIALMNPAAERLTGFSNGDASGKRFPDIVIITNPPEYRSLDPFPVLAGKTRMLNIHLPLTIRTAGGIDRMIEITGSAVARNDETITGTVIVLRDVTERYRIEQEIIRTSKIESLGVFAGGIAHDFNNLLTAITGNVSLARARAEGDEKALGLLDLIARAASRATELTRQMLTFARGGSPVKRKVSIADMLRESASLILSGSGVNATFEIEPGLRQVNADPGQISQMFNNIIINAIQSMENSGAITISACNVSDTPAAAALSPGNYIKISIADQGRGISPSHIQNIFDPYYSTKKNGHGLGLTSSYSIAKRHGGHIGVHSIEGRGTTFDVYLPALDSMDEVRNDESIPETRQFSGRILLMDDEGYILETARGILAHLGFEVTEAADGTEALDLYRKAVSTGRPFDFIILDLTIAGGMGGKETVKRIREIDPEVPVIVSSGYSSDPILSDYRSFGFTAMIGKPYTLKDVAEAIGRIVDETRSTG